DTVTIPTYLAVDDPYTVDKNGKLNFAANIRVFGYGTYGAADCNNSGAAMKIKDAKTRIVSLKLKNITDGTNNTLMTSTRMSSCDRTPKGEPVHTLINGDPGT